MCIPEMRFVNAVTNSMYYVLDTMDGTDIMVQTLFIWFMQNSLQFGRLWVRLLGAANLWT